MIRFFKKKKRRNIEIAPDEIFLDSHNLPDFNTQQFEGRLEKPIPKKSILLMNLFFLFIAILFIWQVSVLQIVKGNAYFKRSENNTFVKQPIFANRGIIYDRNKVMMAWNSWNVENVDKFNAPERNYINKSGSSLLLGYVSYPAVDKSGIYWQEDFIGKDSIEKIYNDRLKGVNGVHLKEVNVKNEIQSENKVSLPIDGEDLILTIDSRIQAKLSESIINMSKNVSFQGGAGAIMDIENGELLAITSYPEYDSYILSKGENKEVINKYFTDKRKVFLNRNIAGVYAPGSIVKPFIGYAALFENIITAQKNIYSGGQISIPNPYFPDKPTIFKDHGTFGYVDMAKAIAVSSDVYFYQIGGGFQDQKGLGILKIDEYSKMFGIGQKTGIDLLGEKEGIIPTPEWKLKVFKGDPWRVGDTYNTSIGQYGFQVTPIQMLRATAGLASFGKFFTPHVLKDDPNFKDFTQIDIDYKNMKVVHEGMRQAVTEGTATALNLANVVVAAKSGTAQVGLGNTNTNSWIIGFFPYEKPKYAFVVMMERGPKIASGNATRVMREVIEYMSLETPEYFE